MKKFLKITGIVIGVLIIIIVIAGLIGYSYVNSTFLDFEGDYTEKSDIESITVDGYTFLDRNGNGEL